MTETLTETEQAQTFDPDTERALLGILLSSPKAIEHACGLGLTAEAFYQPRHAQVFQGITTVHAGGGPVDPVAVLSHLADTGAIGRGAGVDYLYDCVRVAPPAASLGYYVNRVLELAERRKLQEVGVRVANSATLPGRDTADLVALAQDLLAQVQARRSDPQMTSLGSLINPCLDDIEARRDRPTGIETGYADLDQLLGGMRPKQLITIAGVTGVGKSIFVTDVARHVAIRKRLTVAFFSLEMDELEIFDRILAAEARVSYTAIRDGTLGEDDWTRVTARLGPMSNAPLFFAAEGSMTVPQIQVRCEQLRTKQGLDLVVVDHMHLLSPSVRCADDRSRVENISRGLKQMAMDLDVPVLAAAQLSRAPASRIDKRPLLSDLKHASSIEQDSNTVIFVHRDDYYDHESPRAGEVDLIVGKNRSGPKDTVTVAGQLHFARFADMSFYGPGAG